MFSLFKSKEEIQLDAIIARIESNMANNYKDAAQLNLKEFEQTLGQLVESGKLSDKQRQMYEEKLASFQKNMEKFTHKDQVCTWV